MKSDWIRVVLNPMTDVLIREMQRLEGCGHKPRKAWSPQMPWWGAHWLAEGRGHLLVRQLQWDLGLSHVLQRAQGTGHLWGLGI